MLGTSRQSYSRSHFPISFGEPRDIEGDASRLMGPEGLCLPCVGFVFARIEVCERLPIGVPDDIAAGQVVRRCGAGKRRGNGGISSVALCHTPHV